MDKRTLSSTLEAGFLFWICKLNLQSALIANFDKKCHGFEYVKFQRFHLLHILT